MNKTRSAPVLSCQKISKGVVQGSPRNTQKPCKIQKEMAPDNHPLEES